MRRFKKMSTGDPGFSLDSGVSYTVNAATFLVIVFAKL